VSGSSVTIVGNNSIYVTTAAPVVQASDFTVNLGSANRVDVVNGGEITISSVNTNVPVVIASGTIDQISSGTVSIIGNVGTSISTGIVSIIGDVSVSSAGVYILGDISVSNISSGSVSILGNVNTTVANTVQTYSSWLSSNTPSDEVGTLVTGAGVFHGVSVNTGGTNSTVTIYDNTTNTGKKLGTINTVSAGTNVIPDAAYSIGLTYETASGGAADITILWR
jgi:hypothetical protein